MEQLLNHRAAGVVKVWWVEKENKLNPPMAAEAVKLQHQSYLTHIQHSKAGFSTV